MEEEKKEKKSWKRDVLQDSEKEANALWDSLKVYEQDPLYGASKEHETFFVNFPYPYMNGVLHLGHAFTLLKADFMARYERMRGKQSLYPFGLHCTGMPIKACADKLKREIELYGNPPHFPEENEEQGADPAPAAAGAASQTGVFQGKKTKVAQKSGKLKYQWKIMEQMGLGDVSIDKFAEAEYWLRFFPPLAKRDLIALGCGIDWRRSFITTPVNKYYDSFVRWQFLTLKDRGVLAYGKRYTIWSPKDGQPCMDHDRSEGEGIGLTEYTIIKLKLQEPFPEPIKHLSGKNVFILCATLRPETMYGQTNCWALPDAEYGCFESNTDEIFVSTERAAWNLAFQGFSKKHGEVNKVGSVTGKQLIGHQVFAPLSEHKIVYILPMITISTEKGTGLVTSVPADSPDDYTMLREIKKKMDYYGVKPEWVEPFNIVPIIHTELGDVTAETVVEADKKIQGIKSREALEAAKEKVYRLGFYQGTMIIGPHKGKPVQDAKPIVREQLITEGHAIPYAEPSGKIISRSGDVCVVCLADQWYIKYGEETWKKKAYECLDQMNLYDPTSRQAFDQTLDWLREWALSRTYGLGTRLPWDDRWLIESLSDSTIYMAYYTVCHHLHKDMYGDQIGDLNIKAEDLTREAWDYIFLQKPYPHNCAIEESKLKQLRDEFEYWYPWNLRVSGVDLARNHLTFSIYMHTAIWEDKKYWPKGIRLNGHIQVEGEKMAKSQGNFITIDGGVKQYSATALRFALAEAGDSPMDYANFTNENANRAIMKCYTEMEWIEDFLKQTQTTKDTLGHPEKVFESQINQQIVNTTKLMTEGRFQLATVEGFFKLQNARDNYKKKTDVLHAPLVKNYIEVLALMSAPFIPHWSEKIWKLIGKQGTIVTASWPTPGPIDKIVLSQENYVNKALEHFRDRYAFFSKKGERKSATIRFAKAVEPWHKEVVEILRVAWDNGNAIPKESKNLISGAMNEMKKNKDIMKNVKQVAIIAQSVSERFQRDGAEAFETALSFDEGALLNELKPQLEREFKVAINVIEEDGKMRKNATVGEPTINFD